jgi:TolB protein
MDTDGGDVLQLTDRAQSAVSPTWSPDGEYVAFISSRDGLPGRQIYTLDLQDQTIDEVTDDGQIDAFALDWSPDGGYIAFAAFSQQELNPDIFLIEIETGDVRQLTDDPEWDGYPAWSLDGSEIAFYSQRDGPGVHVMDVDGTVGPKLALAFPSKPSWRP